MNVKKLLTNTLLVATLLIGGGTFAWGDDVATYDFEDGTHPFTGHARQTLSVVDNAENGTKVFSFVSASNAYNQYALADYDFSSSVSDASTVRFEFDCLLPTSDVNHWINIGDAEVRAQTADHGGFATRSLGSRGILFRIGTGRISVSGTTETVLAVNNNAIASSATTIKANQVLGKWLHVKVDVDIASKTVDYVIKLKSDETLVVEGSDLAYYNSAAFCCSQIDVSTINNSSTLLMDNLTITKTVDAAKHYYHINAVCGGTTIQNISRGFIDESTEYKYNGLPHYILYGGQYYELDDANVVSYHTTPTYTMGDGNETKEISYTLRNNVKYFKEAESLSGWYNQDQKTDLASGGMSRFLAENKSNTLGMSISAGYYNVCTSVFKRTNGNGNMNTETVYVKNGSTETEIGKIDGWGYPDEPATKIIANVYIAEGSDLKISHGAGNSNVCFDYFYLTSADATLVAAIEDCKANETSGEFATYINAKFAAGEFSAVKDVYVAHTAWQIAQAKANGSTDLTKLIRNAAVTSTDDWGGSRVITLNEQYTGAPDNIFIDANNQTLDANQTIYGVPAGTYTIKAATRAATGIPGTLYVNDGSSDIGKVNQITNVGNTGGDLGNGWSWSEMTFTLTETKDLLIGFWTNAAGGWAGCDDWHMTLGGVSATIGATGWTTFASPYALNLSNMTASEGEVKAYYASAVGGSSVTMTTTEAAIQAGEGIMLKGTPTATITIPVVASGSAIEGNKLVGVTTNTTITKETENYANFYVLSNNGGTAEFQNLKNWLESKQSGSDTEYNTVTINAGKAYLDATTAAPGARLSIVFDDATGISDASRLMDSGEWTKDNVYNLKGQRVSQPTKGLYIVNGKKVIMK